MALYRSPLVVAEPYEDSQGPESPTETSPEELKAFYEDMERVEILERKLSKRKSNSGTSIWSRKSAKRPTTSPAVHPTSPDLPRIPSNSILQETNEHDEPPHSAEILERNGLPRLTSSRSVIADARENPSWAENGAWAAVPLPGFKVKYPLHNPLGPRWYKNHHLIPPSQKRPSMRPPTFFSPSFPPMHTSSSPEHVDDSAESSRTASHSPLPTPTSSQTRVGEAGKPRSRKTSQTAPDTVDLLDLTDPWGTNWHHQSPYDIGQTTTVADAYDVPNRTRRASMTTTQSRHKSVAPSPLSQSTSAVHLQSNHPEIHIPRKLSKRRTPAAANIFDSQPSDSHRKAASAPPTVEHVLIAPSREILPLDSTLPKRMSVAPAPIYSTMQPTPKKEKRGSMLNRLVKKFSILKKSTDDHGPSSDWWHHIDTHETNGYVGSEPVFDKGRSSPEKPHRDSVKRIPPPSVETAEPFAQSEPVAVEAKQNANRASLASVETPYSMGRLTIANPDLPDRDKEASVVETPLVSEAPLPPQKPKELGHTRSQSHANEPSLVQSPQSPTDLRQTLSDFPLRLDKPLPPPQLDTPELSQLRLSDVHAAEAVEQTLSPPSPAHSPDDPPTGPSPELELQPSPPENPKEESPPLPQTNPTQCRNGDNSDPMLSDRSRTLSPPVQSQVVLENPRRTPSQVKTTTSSPKDSPTPAERSRTQSPPVQVPSQSESPKRTSSQSQPFSSKNVDSPSTSRNYVSDRPRNAQASTSSHPSRDSRDRPAEASTSKRQPTKPGRSHSRSESVLIPAPVRVPFPSAQHAATPAAQEDTKHRPATMEYEGSPLSTSSMLANPPTPYDHRLSITMSDAPTVPPKSIYEGNSPQKPSPANPSPSRQTETFTMVRSLSGNVYASSETIMAAGQQWEVVESFEAKRGKEKSSSRSKEQEHRSRDQEHRPRDQEHKSSEPERKSKDYEQRSKDERRSRDYEHRSKDQERRSRDDYRSKDHERASKDCEQRPKEDHRARDYERASKDYEQRAKEEHRARRNDRISKDSEQRSKEEQRARDYERRSKDYEPKPKDEHKSRDYEKRSKEQDYRPKDYDRRSNDYEGTSRDNEHRAKDYDRSSRLEPKRDSKSKLEVDANDYYRSSHRSSKQPAHYQEDSSKSRSNGKTDSRHREERPRHEERSSRKREEYRERKSERKHTADVPSNHHSTIQPHPQPIHVPASSSHYSATIQPHPQPAHVAVQAPNPPILRLERNPSITARPTSELPSAAEMSAVRAKESWEIERLWRARSMYGLEPNATTNNIIPGSSSSSSKSDDAPTHSAVYGSSHTAYVVQTPFQAGLGTQIYHSMPTAPPPIIYSSPASIPSIPDSISSYEPYEYPYRSYPSPTDYRISPSMPMPRPPLNNPLPEPPRETPFEVKSLKVPRPSNKHSNDPWTKYNGITTAH